MNGSIANGLNLVHHYLNTSFTREFQCDIKSQLINGKELQLMLTNMDSEISSVVKERHNHLRPLIDNEKFLNWWPVIIEPFGFHAIPQGFVTMLTSWKHRKDVIEVEKVAFYGDEAKDVLHYCQSVNKKIDGELWQAWAKYAAIKYENKHQRGIQPVNVIPIRGSSM
tara:strand:- start:776 stop:1276 length:501 start_codon:yes stop_codon:yes gene_type:complete